jgi:preprotein translocase subunit Sec61beta
MFWLTQRLAQMLSGFYQMVRFWEENNLGERLARLLVDIILIVHIARTFWPPK